MNSILVVDDGRALNVNVLAHFDRTVFGLTIESDCYSAQQQLALGSFDILLLSTHLDRCNICQWVRANPSTAGLPVISFSLQDNLEERLRYFRMGIDDFLISPFDGRELIARIYAVLERANRPFRQPHVLRAVNGQIELNTQKKVIKIDGKHLQLTQLEFLMLYHLIRVAGNYVPSEDLLDRVWGYSNGTGDPALVRTQISNLRRKLRQAAPDMDWLRSSPGSGYQIPV
jgi:DNA-binding response OmpR family regulator